MLSMFEQENQKTLLLQYKEIQDRIHKRDENIISEIRAIRKASFQLYF